MKNLVIYYSNDLNIKKIVNRYKNTYSADIYEIKTLNEIKLFDKIKNSDILVEKININLMEYDSIILVSPLWFNKIPSPVMKFLEPCVGKINKIIYVLYNNNKEDYPKEFDKLDKLLNLRRNSSFFISIDKKDMHLRTYQ